MKRTIAALLLAVTFASSAFAQENMSRRDAFRDFRREAPEAAYLSPETIGSRQSWLTANHTISASIVGIEYGYEQPLGEIVSIIGRIGLMPNTLTFNYSHKLSECGLNFTSMPGITVEPRVYTSLYKRARQGRNIYMNSGDYISFRFVGAIGFDGHTDVSLTPVYGIRRVFLAHWFHELAVGPSFGYLDKELYFTPYLQYRIGFVF